MVTFKDPYGILKIVSDRNLSDETELIDPEAVIECKSIKQKKINLWAICYLALFTKVQEQIQVTLF